MEEIIRKVSFVRYFSELFRAVDIKHTRVIKPVNFVWLFNSSKKFFSIFLLAAADSKYFFYIWSRWIIRKVLRCKDLQELGAY